MNLGRLNTHRAKSEGLDATSMQSCNYSMDGIDEELPGPENKQKLKKEQWTRIIRIGKEFHGEARLQPILPDMVAFYESPPEAVTSGKKPWALLFDPEACNLTYAEMTLEEMEIEGSNLEQLAMNITVMREQLRMRAAAVASQPYQL